ALGYWLLADPRPSSDKPTGSGPTPSLTTAARIGPRPGKRVSVQLVERRTGALPAPLQDAAAASVTGHAVLLLGGLTATDTSTNTILIARAGGARQHGVLPAALHDSAAVRLGASSYLFGGGNGSRQLDTIVRVDAAGATASVGRLPTPSSDQAAAELA